MEVEMANRVEKGGEIRAGSLYLVVLLGIALHLPSLGWGFFMDDYVHLGVLTGEWQHPQLRSWSLFDFGEVKDFEYRPDFDGGFPWWTDQDWKARFFRPVSSLSVWLDFQMFGEWAPGFHLTNLLLFGLLIRSLYPLYRSWGLGPKAAFMSMLVFACLDDNLTPVGWLANRNSLLATLLIVLAMLLVQRARLESSTWSLLGAFLACGGAVLAKESGVVAFLIVGAYLVWDAKAYQSSLPPLVYRLGLTLAVTLPITYLAAYVSAGYGTRSLFYAMPWDSPVRFLQHLGILLATIWTNLMMPFPLDTLSFHPEQLYWLFWVAALPGVLLMIPLLRGLRGNGSKIMPGLLWLLVTLVPQGGAAISDRLFMLPLVGGVTLLGVFIAGEKNVLLKGARRAVYLLVELNPPSANR